MPQKKTHDEYVADLFSKYGKKVVVLDTYNGQHTKLKHLLMPERKEFLISPKHLLSCKVPSLANLRRNVITPAADSLSLPDYIQQLNNRFDSRIQCLHTDKIRMRSLILHSYKKHKFLARPHRMLHGEVNSEFLRWRSRLYVVGNRICNTEEFQRKLLERNIYTSNSYTNASAKVKVHCLICDTSWTPKAQRVYTGASNCPKCNHINRFSKASILWLNDIADTFGLSIQHADNGGEHSIFVSGNRRVRIDGFCKSLNICFEYYGSVYHGNPKRFPPDTLCHPFRKTKTAGELYQATMHREYVLRELGYTVISIWESEYKIPKEYEKWLNRTSSKISTLLQSRE